MTTKAAVSPALFSQISQSLLAWFKTHGRTHLPWQQLITPYRVWVSEVMLQQTQVATVIPFFNRFIAHFPDVTALASADLDTVLYLWSGLGYYSRARNLHQSARRIVEQFQGQLPLEYKQLLSLPGIGRSTAGAILSISGGQRYPIMDGNVRRVLSRFFALEGITGKPETEKKLWDLAEALTPQTSVGAYTQAIMDLGAMICTRRRPQCERCPLVNHCEAKATGRQEAFPIPAIKTAKPIKSIAFIIVIGSDAHVLLEKRPEKGVWGGGLWSFPECADFGEAHQWVGEKWSGLIKETRELPSFRHTFTHFCLDIFPCVYFLVKPSKDFSVALPYAWHGGSASEALVGVAAPVSRLLGALSSQLSASFVQNDAVP